MTHSTQENKNTTRLTFQQKLKKEMVLEGHAASVQTKVNQDFCIQQNYPPGKEGKEPWLVWLSGLCASL